MGLYPLEELVSGWKHERLTVEQTIGQLVLHVEAVYERLRTIEQRIKGIETPVDSPKKDSRRGQR